MSRKVITLIQTLALSLLPLLLNGFNVSLSVDDTPIHHHEIGMSSEHLPVHWLEMVRKVIKESQKSEKPFEVKTVVIDAGHGGHDPGCSGARSREKHIALAISKKLAEIMRERFPTLNVILTRDKDVFIPLQERAAIANRNNADMFISIHCNYMPGSSATRGSETYVMGLHTAEENLEVAKRENAAILHEDNYQQTYGGYDPNSPEGHIMLSMFQNSHLEQSILLANKVEKKFGESDRKSRGVKQAGFLVLRETAMPSVLIESGFLSSSREEAFLKTADGQLVIANAILEAFVEYKYEVEAVESTSAPILASNIQVRKRVKPMQTSTVVNYPESRAAVEKTTRKSPERTRTAQTYSRSNPENNVALNPKPNFEKQVNRPAPVAVQPEPMVIPIQQNRTTSNAGATRVVYGTVEKKTAPTTNHSKYRKVGTPTNRETIPASNINRATSAQQNIRFCVQLAASPRPLATSTTKWQQVSYRIEVIQESNLYKYQARHFMNFQQAFSAKLQVQKQGFKDAFIVAYKNGEKISIAAAKRELGI